MVRPALSFAFLAVLSSVVVGQPALSQELPVHRPSRPMDMSKGRIEMPLKGMLGGSTPSIAADLGSKLTADSSKIAKPTRPASTLGSTQKPSFKQPRNEKVEPGKVRWHKAIQTAMDASRQSGKPVLLFQMMGHLDDRFC